MTRAYTSGLVKFEYPQELSKLRESYLVSFLENEQAAEMLKTLAQLTAHLIPLNIKSKNMMKETFDTFNSYSEILLPKDEKTSKIEEMTREEKLAIRDKLIALTNELKAKKPKVKAKK